MTTNAGPRSGADSGAGESAQAAGAYPQTRKNVRTTIVLCAVFVLCVVALFVASVTRTSVPSLDELSARGLIVLPAPRDLAIPRLTDERGNVFDASALEGKWSFVFFGYTSCPDVCPVTMSVLRQAELTLDDETFQAVLVSVDPGRDDVDTMRAYVGAFSTRFLGVTGELGDLASFARQLSSGFGTVPAGAGEHYLVDHTAHIAIVDPKGQYTAILKQPLTTKDVVDVFRFLRSLDGPSFL